MGKSEPVAEVATVDTVLERAFDAVAGRAAADAAPDSPLLLVELELLLSVGNRFCRMEAKLVPVLLADCAVD